MPSDRASLPHACRRTPWIALLACLALLGPSPALPAEGPTPRLSENIGALMREATTPGGYLGAVTLVAKGGQVLDWQAFGWRDLARREPMARDSIFRIYSMSKSVAAVAILLLIEQGRLSLDDPVSRYLPEFEHLQVLAGGTAAAPTLRAARRPLTIRHLLTHTPGFATGGPGAAAAAASQLLERAQLPESIDLRDFAARVSRVPLAADPGDRYQYDGVQFEVLGRVIEVASGQPLDVFVRQRIFGPLQMSDTGFSVPASQRGRVVEITTLGADGRLVTAPGHPPLDAGVPLRRYFSLAGGLYSTAPDFMRLCQMLLNGGTLNGVTLLQRKTVEVMLSNQLVQWDPPPGLPATQSRAGEGMGLGGWVILDTPERRRPGSVGSFGWLGAASTYFMIDPQLQLVALLLLQHLPAEEGPALPKLNSKFFDRVYEALPP